MLQKTHGFTTGESMTLPYNLQVSARPYLGIKVEGKSVRVRIWMPNLIHNWQVVTNAIFLCTTQCSMKEILYSTVK